MSTPMTTSEQLFEDAVTQQLGNLEVLDPGTLPRKTCKCCGETKAITEFYLTGANRQPMGRCKKCMSGDSLVNRWVAKSTEQGIWESIKDNSTLWPDNIRDTVTRFSRYFYAGGKIDYKNSEMPGLVTQYTLEHPGEFVDVLKAHSTEEENAIYVALDKIKQDLVDSKALPIEELSQALVDVVDCLTDTVKQVFAAYLTMRASIERDAMPEWSKKKSHNASTNPTPVQLQERAKLVKRIIKDLREHSDIDYVDIDDLEGYFDRLFRGMVADGYADPNLLRSIAFTYAANGLRMSTDMLILYHKFIEPGICITRDRDDYPQLAEQISSIDGVNYYEEPWENIGVEL